MEDVGWVWLTAAIVGVLLLTGGGLFWIWKAMNRHHDYNDEADLPSGR